VRQENTTNKGMASAGDGRDNHLRTTSQQMLLMVLWVQPISLMV
jgi:hypothetical protein